MTRLSQFGLELIKKFEGLSLRTYVDAVGVLTIGYGHTGSDVTEGHKITEEEAERLLLKDVASFESAVNTFTNVRLNQNEYDALVSFSYNVGLGNLKKSTLLKLLNKGEYNKTAVEFKRWCKARVNGNYVKLPGLVKRRYAEMLLFLEVENVNELIDDIKNILSDIHPRGLEVVE